MRYTISGNTLRSENAARSHMQKSHQVVDYLLSKGTVDNILDYGCGKLRYSDTLLALSDNITFVDSEIQLSRQQIIRSERTSVSDYISSNYEKCKSIPIEKISEHKEKYKLITCTNVLSAIPCNEALIGALNQIRRLLHESGTAIFINQHRSSYFKLYKSGDKHLYGHLYKGNRGIYYYGILNKEQTINLLTNQGFVINRSWNNGESNYIEAGAGV